jgi:hypothetical protein
MRQGGVTFTIARRFDLSGVIFYTLGQEFMTFQDDDAIGVSC